MTDQTPPREDVVLVEVNGGGATFATANAGDGFQLKAIRRYEAALCPTFTNALQDYARDRGISLNGRSLAISVAGVVRGDAVRVTNGRWFLSQSGLTQMLGRAPVVLNNVSAITWATRLLPASALRPIGSFANPSISAKRRIAVIWLGEGLGTACLGHSEKGTPYVLDGEGGHMTASPETPEELEVFGRLHRHHSHISFERILALESRDGAWSTGMNADAILAFRAGLLGSFAGSVALAFGAWDGVYVGGPHMAALTTPELVGSFRERFVSKGRYRNQLTRVPIWGIEQTNLALSGAAACLAELSS